MKYFRVFIVSGLPRRVASIIQDARRALLAKDEYLCVVDREVMGSASNLSERLRGIAIKKFHYDRQQRFGHTQFVHVHFYLDSNEDYLKEVAQSLFCLTIGCQVRADEMAYHGDGLPKAVASSFLRQCQSRLKVARIVLDALKREIQGADARTPLLLPPRNFKSKELWERIGSLPQSICDAGNQIEEFKKQVAQMRVLAKLKHEDRKWSFTDEKGRRFESPPMAGARHGDPSTEHPHNVSCYLNGHLRLGVPFHSRFHYDCTERGTISAEFFSCHSDAIKVDKAEYVNIAPNDNVRVPSSKKK